MATAVWAAATRVATRPPPPTAAAPARSRPTANPGCALTTTSSTASTRSQHVGTAADQHVARRQRDLLALHLLRRPLGRDRRTRRQPRAVDGAAAQGRRLRPGQGLALRRRPGHPLRDVLPDLRQI